MPPHSFDWPLPQGYRLADEMHADDRPKACMIAHLDGRNRLCSIIAFQPSQPQFTIVSATNEAGETIAHGDIKWVRLLDEAELVNQNGDVISDSAWDQACEPFVLEFNSGEKIDGHAIGQVRTETGWLLYQAKRHGRAIRYFIPHASIKKLTVGSQCLSEMAAASKPKEMKNQKMAALFQDMPDKYPYALEEKFQRILNKLTELWDTPEVEDYFTDLMVDRRGDRQGFPPDVAANIVALSKLHEMLKQQAPQESNDPWEYTRARQELDEMGITFRPQQFMSVLERGDQATAELFIKGGIDINYVGESGWTPLMIASFNGNENIAKLLIEKGANILVQDNAGYSPIHWAAFNGFKEVTGILLRKGANPNSTNRYGWTPLLQAAARGHTEVAKMLLDAGASVNQSDEEGWTPLHKATANRHLDTVKLLLEKGADINAAHRSGATPLSIATEKNKTEILQLFRNPPRRT